MNYHVIGACSCWGAKLRACELGPEDLVTGGVIERLKKKGIAVGEVEMLYPELLARNGEIPLSQSLPLIYKFNLSLQKAVKRAVRRGLFPVVLGGDHSVAVGTWNAFEEPFGLVWIDAHLDSHTSKTTPSGAYHGMPVAALLGYGDPEMAQLVKKESVLKPENVAFIGARSYEKEELAFLKERGVRIYFMEEVKKRGLREIFPEAIAHVLKGVSKFGVSLDLDVFDVEDAPGVGSPEKDGIRKKELLPLLSKLASDPRLIGFELVEFNPKRDVGHKTRELAFEILNEVMGGSGRYG